MDIDFATARQKMVDNQVRTTDVTSHALLGALLSVPRENFVPSDKKVLAYIDNDIELESAGRFLMEPSPLAKLLQAASINAGDKVLEIGAASGYVSALMAHMGASVVALEADEALYSMASELLDGDTSVKLVKHDFEKGAKSDGPFDLIFINGAIEQEPDDLFDQIAEDGRMIAVIGTGGAAQAYLYVKENGHVSSRRLFNLSIPALPAFAKEEEFVF